MIALKINNIHPQYPILEKEIEPQENCKQIIQLITQPNSKETFLNTIDKILFQKWNTEIKIVIDKCYPNINLRGGVICKRGLLRNEAVIDGQC